MPAIDFTNSPNRRAQPSNLNSVAPDRMMGGLAAEAGVGVIPERPGAGKLQNSAERVATLVDRSLQFERLVSGEEGIAGDMPPAYSDTVNGIHGAGEERGRVMFSQAVVGGSRAGSRQGSRSRAGSRSRPGSRPVSRPVSRATSMIWS